MYKSRRRLPPLTALPSFEAAARLLSFTRAAEELYVSQAAISRQVRVLEENLGTKLFERSHRTVKLTADGQRLQHTVAVALDLVETTASELRNQTANSGLTIAADLSMAHLWFLPRLPDFRDRFPEVAVCLVASDSESDCLKDGIDLALLYGSGSWPGFDAHLLVKEEIFPVCSPNYQVKGRSLCEPADLLNEDLLDLKGERWDWVDWRQWLTEYDVSIPEGGTFIGFNSLPLLIQAASRGQGVGLGWKTLVDPLIADGTLIRPIDFSLHTDRGYYVLKNAEVRMSPETKILYEWIINMSESNAART